MRSGTWDCSLPSQAIYLGRRKETCCAQRHLGMNRPGHTAVPNHETEGSTTVRNDTWG